MFSLSNTPSAWRSNRTPAILFFILVVLITMAPDEKSIGAIIKLVYIHVALIWIGTAGYAILSLFSLSTLFLSTRIGEKDLNIIHFLSLGSYTLGVILSMAAAKAAWGSVSWSEPLMQISMTTIALSLTILFLRWSFPHALLRLTFILPGLYLFWATTAKRNILHPNHPITAGTPLAMKLTFYCTAVLFLGFAFWLWLRLRDRNL